MAAHGRRRSVRLWALAAVAGAHGLAVVWLAAQISVLKFRAQTVPDRSSMVISLQRLPGAAVRARPPVRPPPFTLPAPPAASSGPMTIDQGEGTGETSNLARPVFLQWPHPVAAGVDWGPDPQAAAASKLALAGGWAGCRGRADKDEDAWSPTGKVKAPCLRR